MRSGITRAEFLRLSAGTALLAMSPFSLAADMGQQPVRRRAIPSSGEQLPVIGVRVSSTRRFCWRPSGVSFDATGWVLPKPAVATRWSATPLPSRYLPTVEARRSDNAWLVESDPTLSV